MGRLKLWAFPIKASPHEIIPLPHYGIFTTIADAAIRYITSKRGGGGGVLYTGKDLSSFVNKRRVANGCF